MFLYRNCSYFVGVGIGLLSLVLYTIQISITAVMGVPIPILESNDFRSLLWYCSTLTRASIYSYWPREHGDDATVGLLETSRKVMASRHHNHTIMSTFNVHVIVRARLRWALSKLNEVIFNNPEGLLNITECIFWIKPAVDML